MLPSPGTFALITYIYIDELPLLGTILFMYLAFGLVRPVNCSSAVSLSIFLGGTGWGQCEIESIEKWRV